ncbi:uncharacterized protein [Panulirus ornatus]|uniref:uncharacterized protein n=1 Tax=Panulirus ornatus TaxID=150431 RepID=UPI003A85597C
MTHKDEDKMDIKDEDKVDILVDTNSAEVLNKLEVLFYEVSNASLTLPSGTCTINLDECLVTSLEIDKDATSFSILLVGVDSSEAVLQSTLLSFEDYKVVVQQLTADAVEVRWTASEKTLYKVAVSPNGGAYSETTVTCGNDESNKCKAYFISISDPDTRTVRVQKNEDGEKNIVASEFTMESLATETSQSAKLMLRKLNDKTYLSVCLEKQANATANYTLAIIDQKGTFIDTTGTVTSPCFPELALNTLIMEHLRVLVHAKLDDMEEPLVALDTEVYLFANLSSAYSPLQVIQISARTLKASWVNRNRDNLQYELALNGKTSKVQCKAKAECVKYFHLNSAQEPLIINITEKNKGIVLIATADVPIKDILGKFTR